MDNKILIKILNIGFEYINREYNGFGLVEEYRYYPKYFKDEHYTLIVFRNDGKKNIMTDTDYNLYIHKNLDDSFVKSIFQCSFKSYVHKYIDNIFETEILRYKRKNKLNRILEE